MKVKRLRVADLFCGAGGFSEGLKEAAGALGYEVDLTAINHWSVAIETHRSTAHRDAVLLLEAALPAGRGGRL